jgi:hypothetical protein
MRVVPGGVISFPESTLLVDTQTLEYFLEQVNEAEWFYETDVILDDSYRNYLVNWGVSSAISFGYGSNTVISYECLIHKVDGGMGSVALVLGGYSWINAWATSCMYSQGVGVWLSGRLHFQMRTWMPFESDLYVRMIFIFNRYRR